MPQFNPYDNCPCESGKKAKFCCLNGKQWNKKPNFLKPLDTNTEFSHPECFANETKKCSTKISKEHIISNNILHIFELNNKVKITGLPWQDRGEFNLLSRSNLVSKILCTTHNQLLSPFDSEMGRLFRSIQKFDEDFNLEYPKDDLSVFCGEDIEKWMLKTVCAFIASNQICVNGEKINCILKDEYIEILFNDKPFPEKWGMYFKIPKNNQIQKFPSCSIRAFTANGELKSVEFLVHNFMFYLLLGKPDNQSSFGIYRPKTIELAKDNIKKRIEICWQDKKYKEVILMDRIRTTKEFPPEWDEYLKK